jgi:hypothetical protein
LYSIRSEGKLTIFENSFDIIKNIGEGIYGKVFQVRDK